MADDDDLRSTIIAAMSGDDPSPADGSAESAPGGAPPDKPAVPLEGPTIEPPGAAPQRDAQGRFLPRSVDPAARPSTARDAAQTIAQPAGQQQPPGRSLAGPPPGWSVAGKAAYDQLPPAVKADIAQREAQIAQGFQKLTDYKGLDDYVNMARNQGTTLPEALQRYVDAEDLLDRDPLNGILWLCERYNVHPGQLMQAIGGGGYQTPPPEMGAYQNGAGGGYQIPPELAPLVGHLQALNNRVSYFEQQQSDAMDQSINSEIDAFGADPGNRFFPNVRYEMGRLIAVADAQGQEMSLKEAYDRACWTHPEIRAHFIQDEIRKQTAGTQRRTDKVQRSSMSLSPGSPVPGGTLTSSEPAASLREEIERAYYGNQI